MKKYNLVVCGGTFDHFHKGHREFLRYVFSVGKKIIIGVTSDEYVRNSKFSPSTKLRTRIQNSKLIEPFEKRKKSVLEFMKTQGVLDKTTIVEINDLFGPVLSKNFSINAIVVSKDTKKGADIINKRRKKIGLKGLNLLIASQVLAEDGKLISSGRIRKGEIDREGKLYVNPLWIKKNLILPENLRKEFRKPFGELFRDVDNAVKDRDKNFLVITVGDITTKIFNDNSLGQNISVIDFKVAREKKFYNILELGFSATEEIFKVNNPAGSITFNLFIKLSEIFKSEITDKVVLQINGEEDLAVLPLVLVSPLNTIIYYGQPNKGVVKVIVSEISKNKAYKLVSKLKPI